MARVPTSAQVMAPTDVLWVVYVGWLAVVSPTMLVSKFVPSTPTSNW
jgi:hypothetical protein